MSLWKLNTSNLGKYEEFKLLFEAHGASLEATHIDLKEIDADPVSVIVHKASQFDESILVDDTSLDIEGGRCGIHVRHLLDQLNEFAGCHAVWTVLLGIRKGNEILIYRGAVPGMIVKPQGNLGFGFDPVFLPDGTDKTLAQERRHEFNARRQAVLALLENRVWKIQPLNKNWDGPWQNSGY